MKTVRLTVVLCWLFVNIITATHRQASLEVLRKVNNAISSLQQNQSAIIQDVASARQAVKESLRNFYYSSIFIKANSLELAIGEEELMLQFGETIDDKWCWENNVPLLEGSIGWVGNGYSDCVKKVDKEIMDIVGNIYSSFQDVLQNIQKYDLLEVFLQRNIISNPQSISDAMDELIMATASVAFDYSVTISELNKFLNSRLDAFSVCLESANDEFRHLVVDMQSYTAECMES